MENHVNFINDSKVKYLQGRLIQKSVLKALHGENISDASLNIVVVEDDKIQQINNDFLQHDYATDVISFRLEDEPLEGEVYIGIGVAKEQSEVYKVSLTNELCRLAVHGTLHIIGYDDDNPDKKQIMHDLENKYIEN